MGSSNNMNEVIYNYHRIPTNSSGTGDNIGNITVLDTGAGSSLSDLIIRWLDAFDSLPRLQFKIAFNIVYSLGILANALLLTYLVYYKRYKSPVFCVILMLGVSDFGVCLSAAFLSLIRFPMIVGPPWLCKLDEFLIILSFVCSNYQIVVLAILRFFQLVYPLASRAKITTSLLSKICLTIWSASLIQAAGFMTSYSAVKVTFKEEQVFVCWFMGNYTIMLPWLSVGCVSLPFLATFGFHLAKHIAVAFRKTDSVNMTSSSDPDKRGHRQTDSRALAMVIIVYLVTVFPTVVQFLRLSLFGALTGLDFFLLNTFIDFSYCNSSINPYIYLFAAESVRADIRNMFTCIKTLKKIREH